MITTTTNSIEGVKILRYLDVVFSNIVIGTNVFSDISASFADLFGGKSKSYQNKLDLIRNEAIKELKAKAADLGANALISLHVDFDEISGGGKSMFMVSASATACLLECSPKKEEKIIVDYISLGEVNIQLQKNKVISKFKEGKNIDSDDLEFIIANPILEIIDDIISLYSKSMSSNNCDSSYFEYIERAVSNLPFDQVCDIVYKRYVDDDKMLLLIKNAKLFNAKKVHEFINIDIHKAISLLDSSKAIYTNDDLNEMMKIVTELDRLPDLGKIEAIKGGLLSKDSDKYICPNGHKNDSDITFCSKSGCGLNIKGLMYEDVYCIDSFKKRSKALNDIFNNNKNSAIKN